jgi:hypothetical protein
MLIARFIELETYMEEHLSSMRELGSVGVSAMFIGVFVWLLVSRFKPGGRGIRGGGS